MIDAPDSDEHGLFLRDKDGTPQVIDRKTKIVAANDKKGLKPDLKGDVTLKDGRKAVPVFMKMAETYMDKAYAPDAVAEATGVSAAQIKAIAAELARVAFDEEIVICLLYTSPSPRDRSISRMPSSA